MWIARIITDDITIFTNFLHCNNSVTVISIKLYQHVVKQAYNIQNFCTIQRNKMQDKSTTRILGKTIAAPPTQLYVP